MIFTIEAVVFQVSEVKVAEKRGTPGKKTGKASDAVFKDPLSDLGPLGIAIDGTDPLSMIAAEANSGLGSKKNRTASFVSVDFDILSLKHFSWNCG